MHSSRTRNPSCPTTTTPRAAPSAPPPDPAARTTAADLATLALAAVEPIAGSVADDPIRLAILPE
ncbi:hypothetical protein, partial [Clavibacter michiganensis]|uniref:hypothetical protein n=1 Tax=Clavibacter michiganensis TaxID=28447 RepID=UPI00293007D4